MGRVVELNGAEREALRALHLLAEVALRVIEQKTLERHRAGLEPPPSGQARQLVLAAHGLIIIEQLIDTDDEPTRS